MKVCAIFAMSVGAVRAGRLLCESEATVYGGGVIQGVDREDLIVYELTGLLEGIMQKI